MLRVVSLLYVLTFLPFPAFSQNSVKITHGPYLTAPTAQGVTVVFTSNVPGVASVHLRESAEKASAWTTVQNSVFGLKAANERVHRIELKGLDAGKSYEYCAVFRAIEKFEPYKIFWGDSIATGPFPFTIATPQAQSMRFAVFNDVHGHASRLDSLLVAGPLAATDFITFNGDMVNHLEDPNQLFEGFIDVATKRFASHKPFLYVRGNHETRGAMARALPQFLPPAEGQYYGLYRQGPVAFIVLDTGEDKPDAHWAYSGLTDFDAYREAQAAWLESAVHDPAFTSAPFRIAILHIPPYGDDWHGTQEVRRLFAPVLAAAGLDLMIAAHTHEARWLTAEETDGFPVLINGIDTGVWIEVDAESIRAERIDTQGKTVETRVIPLRR